MDVTDIEVVARFILLRRAITGSRDFCCKECGRGLDVSRTASVYVHSEEGECLFVSTQCSECTRMYTEEVLSGALGMPVTIEVFDGAAFTKTEINHLMRLTQ